MKARLGNERKRSFPAGWPFFPVIGSGVPFTGRRKPFKLSTDSLSGSRDCLRGDVAVFDGGEIPQ